MSDTGTQSPEATKAAAVAGKYTRLADLHHQVRGTRTLLDRLAARRREAVVALIAEGQTHAQIAEAMGVSKSAIQQIVQKG